MLDDIRAKVVRLSSLLRDGAVVACLVHTQKVGGAIPSPASKFGPLEELESSLACHAGDHGFKSRTDRQL